MDWLSIIGSIFRYVSLPIRVLFNWLLIALSPVIHLAQFITASCLLPFRLLAKLEVSYASKHHLYPI